MSFLEICGYDNCEDVRLCLLERGREGGRERETFSAVHVRASNLVHQQHEDEAQHQRDADARVQLLVAVLVAGGGDHGLVSVHLGLRHFHGASVAVVVVFTCGKGTTSQLTDSPTQPFPLNSTGQTWVLAERVAQEKRA